MSLVIPLHNVRTRYVIWQSRAGLNGNISLREAISSMNQHALIINRHLHGIVTRYQIAASTTCELTPTNLWVWPSEERTEIGRKGVLGILFWVYRAKWENCRRALFFNFSLSSFALFLDAFHIFCSSGDIDPTGSNLVEQKIQNDWRMGGT